jgi:hypothetical protein
MRVSNLKMKKRLRLLDVIIAILSVLNGLLAYLESNIFDSLYFTVSG